MKSLKWSLVAVALFGFAQGATEAMAKGPGTSSFLTELLGIDALQDDVADLQDENASQQSQIDTLLSSVSALNVTVGANSADIATLFECKDILEERIERLEAVVDCPDDGAGGFEVCNIDGTNYCIDTDSSDENCGACGTACAITEFCDEGTCTTKPCDPIDQCHTAALDPMTGICVQSNVSNDTFCDDNLGCTVADICQNGVCVGFGSFCDGCTEDGMGGAVCP